jgi:hypothetical protein
MLNGGESPLGPGRETSDRVGTLDFGLIQSGGLFPHTVQGVGGFKQLCLGKSTWRCGPHAHAVRLNRVAAIHAHARVADDAGGVGGARGVGLFLQFARRPVQGPAEPGVPRGFAQGGQINQHRLAVLALLFGLGPLGSKPPRRPTARRGRRRPPPTRSTTPVSRPSTSPRRRLPRGGRIPARVVGRRCRSG